VIQEFLGVLRLILGWFIEGTADMMDWAARKFFSALFHSSSIFMNADLSIVHARDRGAESWWKSFTTGKSAETVGGVPHDTYGMTSLSIRQYVLGIYKQLGLREKDITKVQTGGPGMFFFSRRVFLLNSLILM
jgi:glutamate dehydrogenase